MNYLRLFSIFLTILFATSCGTKGGAPEDITPASGSLLGKIKGDYYFAPGDAFSVMLPHPPSRSSDDMYETMHTQIREINNKRFVGVIFGPAAVDHNDYHFMLSKRPISGDHERFVRNLFARNLKRRNGDYEQEMFETDVLSGKTRYYAVYKSDTAYLVMSLVEDNNHFYLMESDIYTGPLFNTIPLETLLAKKWLLFNRMQDSFTAPAMKISDHNADH